MVTTTPPGRPESPGAQHAPLVFTDPGGRQHSAPARFGPPAHRDAALPLRARRVLLGRREVQCVQVFLSRADAATGPTGMTRRAGAIRCPGPPA
ncbi:hypothetical protein SCALM49S_00771 [Streptomyces californicus]